MMLCGDEVGGLLSNKSNETTSRYLLLFLRRFIFGDSEKVREITNGKAR